ncbi:MAG: DEAD/DEAH box helicase family protein, partial [Solobacterium sp.]|nr:DEAD/DEAH box helicase family protein [Solobacterium sp.]
MQCPRCLNTDSRYFYKGSRGWYCRRCISFGRIMLEEEKEPVSLSPVSKGSEEYTLQYPLTGAQAEIAVKCASLIGYKDVLLHCVCGAGKTELVVLSIAKMLKEGKKVCFAIPRRQVVLELRERLAQYFPHAVVIAVCGGHTSVTDGDLIICTTHQLYRYWHAFDLLILDAYGIIGLNSKGSANKGFLKLSPILFSPQMRLMIDLRRKHAQNEDLSAKRSAACNSGSTVSDVVPSRLLQRQSAEHTPDVDLHRSTVRYSKDVS